MSSYVVDTSVVCAWYLPEDFAPAARQWRARLLAGEVELIVPGLHYWEFGNVLRTYVMRREIPEELAREIYDLLLAAPLRAAEPARSEVFKTALACQAAVCDAVFMGLSLELGVPFITAERTTTPWVKRLGKRIVSVRKRPAGGPDPTAGSSVSAPARRRPPPCFTSS